MAVACGNCAFQISLCRFDERGLSITRLGSNTVCFTVCDQCQLWRLIARHVAFELR
jgi:hypothetical protein